MGIVRDTGCDIARGFPTCYNALCPVHGRAARRQAEKNNPFRLAVRDAMEKLRARQQAVRDAERNLRQWRRKLKLAQTKVKVWERKLRARQRALEKVQHAGSTEN